MAAGYVVRNHSTVIGSERPEAMFTIQCLADPDWSTVDLDAARAALTAAYAAAFVELADRVEAAHHTDEGTTFAELFDRVEAAHHTDEGTNP